MWGSWFGVTLSAVIAVLFVVALAAFAPALLAVIFAVIAVLVIAALAFGANRKDTQKDPVAEQPATVTEPGSRQERYSPNTEDVGAPASGEG
jgi:hypothetical protein